jgi:hypothetical protein
MGLGGDDELVAMACDEVAQNGLGLAAGVDVGRVEEVDADVAAAEVHGAGRGLVSLAAERHRAEAQRRYLNARVAERSIFHGSF